MKLSKKNKKKFNKNLKKYIRTSNQSSHLRRSKKSKFMKMFGTNTKELEKESNQKNSSKDRAILTNL